jgi:hypothetical protein
MILHVVETLLESYLVAVFVISCVKTSGSAATVLLIRFSRGMRIQFIFFSILCRFLFLNLELPQHCIPKCTQCFYFSQDGSQSPQRTSVKACMSTSRPAGHMRPSLMFDATWLIVGSEIIHDVRPHMPYFNIFMFQIQSNDSSYIPQFYILII